MRASALHLAAASVLLFAGTVSCSQPQTVCDQVAATIPFELDMGRQLSEEQRSTLAERFEGTSEDLEGEGNLLFRSERRDWELRMLRENHAKEIEPIVLAMAEDTTLRDGAQAELHSASLHGHEHLYVLGLAVLERRVGPNRYGANENQHVAVGEALAAVCESHRH